ncbi:hypothetical protein EDD15DRAFT_2246034 [Pisolithus albus]|nr:hypothetical protein EDD15DRAFT_2246034 [Pisolithus albus]
MRGRKWVATLRPVSCWVVQSRPMSRTQQEGLPGVKSMAPDSERIYLPKTKVTSVRTAQQASKGEGGHVQGSRIACRSTLARVCSMDEESNRPRQHGSLPFRGVSHVGDYRLRPTLLWS